MRLISVLSFFLLFHTSYSQEELSDWKKLDRGSDLYSYIIEQGYDHLNFEPGKEEKVDAEVSKALKTASNEKVYIRDYASIKQLNYPLLILNGVPINEIDILKNVSIGDVKNISILMPGAISMAIYGIRGKFGILIIQIKKSKWRRLKRSL